MRRHPLRVGSVWMGITVVLVMACSSTTSSPSSGAQDAGTTTGGTQCTAARDQLLVPVAKVSTAVVKVVRDEGGVTTLYVDGSAGGFDQARRNPRVYVSLRDNVRVEVTDVDAPSSPDWDLAFKRQVIFTNSGDAGVGKGGGARIPRALSGVTAADVEKVGAESFFDGDCNAQKDEIEDPRTSFTGWYDYDQAVMRASPKANVSFIVRSAAGTEHYAIAIKSYTAKPDGTTTAPSTGFYLLEIRKL
jgi:hypothetical protein